ASSRAAALSSRSTIRRPARVHPAAPWPATSTMQARSSGLLPTPASRPTASCVAVPAPSPRSMIPPPPPPELPLHLASTDAGQIVGEYRDAGGLHGFFRSSGGIFTTLDAP